jgi:hypothetical protein
MLLLLLAAGCSPSVQGPDPAIVAAHRQQLVLQEEPEGVVGVLEARELVVGPDEGDAAVGESSDDPSTAANTDVSTKPAEGPQEVVIIGKVGGVPNPWKQAQPDYPWSPKQAQFVMADAAAAAEVEDHSHAHDHDDPDHDCPFCAEGAASQVVAVVCFKDEAGQVIPIDARQLFELKGEETVVVRGKAHLVGNAKDGVLMVDADGLYVRR